MSSVRKRIPARRVSTSDIRRIVHLPELRDGALRAAEDGRFWLNKAEHHKSLTTALYVACETSGLPTQAAALEFYRMYAHLVAGDSVDSLPTALPNRAQLISRLRAVYAGRTTEEDDDHGT